MDLEEWKGEGRNGGHLYLTKRGKGTRHICGSWGDRGFNRGGSLGGSYIDHISITVFRAITCEIYVFPQQYFDTFMHRGPYT